MIESQSSSSDSDDNNFDTMKLMENKNPMLRLIVYGKIKKMMMSYAGQKLKSIDKKLLRGIYVRKIKDFKEDQREKQGNKSIFQNLLEGFKLNPSFKDKADEEDDEIIQEFDSIIKKKKFSNRHKSSRRVKKEHQISPKAKK